MQTDQYAISVHLLKKSFQNVPVLRDVTFDVKKGSIFSLLGSNGAGKTTIIKILTTLIKPDSGTVKVDGFDIREDISNIHNRISLTGQFTSLDESLTGLENLILMGQLNHLANPRETAGKLLNYFELTESAKRLVSAYSGGMKRKLDIAMSLAGNPSIIFLDEPTTGLDPQSRQSMWKIIRQLNQSGVTIFLTTQYLEEAEQLADKIGILNNGTMIAEGTAEELKKSLPHGMLEFIFPNKDMFEKAVSLMTGYRMVCAQERRKLVIYTDGKANTLSKIFCILTSHAIEIQHFSQLLPTLEDVFFTIIKKEEDVANESE